MRDWDEWERRLDAARKQAASSNFSTRNNPLVEVTPQEAVMKARVERNMDALYRDAERREHPCYGASYAAIMDTRYNGGDQ